MNKRVIVRDPDGGGRRGSSKSEHETRQTTLIASLLMTLISAPIVIAAERSVIEV